MKTRLRLLVNIGLPVIIGALPANAQGRQEPGHSIGAISTQGELIVMTLDEGVLGKAKLFDLAHHTLRLCQRHPDTGWKTWLSSGIRISEWR